MTQGPNVKRLICHKMSVDIVPAGGGLQSVLTALITPGRLTEHAKSATSWVTEAIAVVKTAPDNPYGDDDEAIAGEILRLIDLRETRSAV